MAANRRTEETSHRWGILIRGYLACGIISTFGILYVQQNKAHDRLGVEISEKENERDELKKSLALQHERLAVLTSDPELRARAQWFGLGLSNTPASQRITVYVPSEDETYRGRELEGRDPVPGLMRGPHATLAQIDGVGMNSRGSAR